MSSRNVRPDPFADLIFTTHLESQLRFMYDHPEVLEAIPVVCFYGYAGLGKTTVARIFADAFCSDTRYFAMNEASLDSKFVDEEIRPLLRTNLFDRVSNDEYLFNRCIILDEFHNLTPKEQDRFKVVFDEMKKTLVIVCLNTTEKRGIGDQTTEPILSRMNAISFNTPSRNEDDLQYLVNKVIKIYPSLSRDRVYDLLPDMRSIRREGTLNEMQSNLAMK